MFQIYIVYLPQSKSKSFFQGAIILETGIRNQIPGAKHSNCYWDVNASNSVADRAKKKMDRYPHLY